MRLTELWSRQKKIPQGFSLRAFFGTSMWIFVMMAYVRDAGADFDESLSQFIHGVLVIGLFFACISGVDAVCSWLSFSPRVEELP